MKNFFIKLSCVIMVIATILLSFSLTIEKTIVNAVSSSFTKSEITKRIVDEAVLKFADLDRNSIEKIRNTIANSKEIDEISSLVFNNLVQDIKNDTITEINLSDRLTGILKDNMKEIPQVYHAEIISRVNSINYNQLYKNLIYEIKSRNKEEVKLAFNIYDNIINNQNRIMLASILLISLILIFTIEQLIEAIFRLGISFMIQGGIIIVLVFLFKQVGTYLFGMAFGIPIELNFTVLTIIGISSLALGFAMIELYEIKQKKLKKEK